MKPIHTFKLNYISYDKKVKYNLFLDKLIRPKTELTDSLFNQVIDFRLP
jgi:hypothetical protein